jgi:hypothetical protein
VPAKIKRQVFAEYLLEYVPKAYEIDHFISLELGSSNSIQNLWPQTDSGAYNSHTKDVLENRLHKLVCAATIPLEQPQKEITTDWLAAYRKYGKNRC